jgi:hypothetical protein
MPRFRRRRLTLLISTLGVSPANTVLDVGGSWAAWWEFSPFTPKLTLLNVSEGSFNTESIPRVVGDGTALPFADSSFDVVVSNSVIEHVGGWSEQVAFAEEVRRVGRAYYVQTPNRNFPLEPHVLTPFFQWLPKRWQRRLVRNLTLRGLLERPDAAHCDELTYGIRLLNRREMAQLFPDAELIPERFLGFVKSWVVLKRADRFGRVPVAEAVVEVK